MNNAMRAIIKKDFKGVISNKLLYSRLYIVPIVMVVLIPTIFLIASYFSGMDDIDVKMSRFLSSLPVSLDMGRLDLTLANISLNFLVPMFFLTIPIMTGSTMAASAFVGEKERQTLKTLLYCPLTLKDIFKAKVLASLVLSLLVTAVSFVVLVVVFETESYFILGSFVALSPMWAVILLLLVPSISMLAIILIVRSSAKAQSVEEAQQSASYLVFPLLAFIIPQLSGLFFLNIWIIAGVGVVCAFLAWIFFNKAMQGFTYEKIVS